MDILYYYCAAWIAVPLAGLGLATKVGIGRQWRGLVFYISSMVGLIIASVFIHDPLEMFLNSIDPDFYSQIGRVNTGNYFIAQLMNYSILALGIGLIISIRPHVSVMLTSLQFWLFHIGAIVSIVPLAWWAMQQTPGPLAPPINPGAWSIIATYGIIFILVSILVLLGLVIWAFWTKFKAAAKD